MHGSFLLEDLAIVDGRLGFVSHLSHFVPLCLLCGVGRFFRKVCSFRVLSSFFGFGTGLALIWAVFGRMLRLTMGG
jgi:hypothetical protein